MKYFVVVLFLVAPLFAVNPIARWPFDDQTGTATIRDVIGTTDGTWVGTNLVTNGTFTGNADNWSLDSGWVYGSNAVTATADGTTDFLSQIGTSLVFGTMYRIKYDISNSDMDFTGLQLAGAGAFGSQNLDHTNGTHIYYFPKTNASPSRDILFSISSNSTPGKVLTIDNISVREVAFSKGTGIVFDGTGDYVDIGTGPSVVKTISLWVNQDDVAGSEYPIDLNGTDYLSVVSGVVTVSGLTGHTLYVDGVAGTSGATTIDATWHHIVITDSSNNNASDLDIGRVESAGYFAGRISDVRLYSVVLTADEVKGLLKGEGRRRRYNNKEYEAGLRSRYN